MFAGIIVCIALLGMFALGVSFLYGLAVAAAIGVAFTMIAALTLLPAFLGFIGPRVMSRRQRAEPGRQMGHGSVGAGSKGSGPGGPTSSGGGRHSRQSSPCSSSCRGPAVLLPAAGLVRPGQRSDRHHHPAGLRHAGRRVRSGVQRAAPAGCGAQRHGRHRRPWTTWPTTVGAQPGVAAVVAAGRPSAPRTGTGVPDHRLPDSSPQDAGHHQPDRPPANQTPSRRRSSGTGADRLRRGEHGDLRRLRQGALAPSCRCSSAWWSSCRSCCCRRCSGACVIPLTAAVMNMLSIGAAFGVMVAVFQWGWLGSLFGVERTGTDRGLPAGDAVRHPLRSLHGLRGVPGYAMPFACSKRCGRAAFGLWCW